jgi:fermentation-respiration switch protein FrsA (DUF1100 family)
MRKALLWTVALLAMLYLGAMGMAFARQRAMIYPAPARSAEAMPPGLSRVALQTSDGLRLEARYSPARGDLPTLVFFHGNGDNLSGAFAATGELADAGYGLLLVEYRGYGGNPGSPTEAGLYRDGEAALQWLVDRKVPPGHVVLIGNSLGSGVATQLAMTQDVAGLVLISGFASLAEVAALHIRIFPVRLLLLDRYDNAAKLPRVAAPVLVLHGTEDRLIPPAQGEALARAARRSTLVLVPHAGHELAYLPQSRSAIAQWLRRLSSRSAPGSSG